jgi:hypothetical protein
MEIVGRRGRVCNEGAIASTDIHYIYLFERVEIWYAELDEVREGLLKCGVQHVAPNPSISRHLILDRLVE